MPGPDSTFIVIIAFCSCSHVRGFMYEVFSENALKFVDILRNTRE